MAREDLKEHLRAAIHKLAEQCQREPTAQDAPGVGTEAMSEMDAHADAGQTLAQACQQTARIPWHFHNYVVANLAAGCTVTQPLKPCRCRPPGNCLWPTEDRTGRILLTGEDGEETGR